VPNATSADIGATLRAARESLGTSVEEASWKTRIRPEYLRALEEDRFDACGHLANARTHLHSYARFLGLDAAAIVREYVERYEHAEPSPITKLDEQVKEARRPPKPNWLIAAVVAGVVLIGASLVGIVHGPGPRAGNEHDALPSLPASPAVSASPSAPAIAAGPVKGVTLVVVTRARSWVQVAGDGAPIFAGTLAAGVSKTFSATQELDVTVGNAGAVRLILNGKDLGSPGASGTVYRAKLGPQGPLPAK